jgi:hypothetical protein
MPREFVRAMGIIERSAAEANMSLGCLDQRIGKAIMRAATEVADGKFDHEFVVDVYQTGFGTSTNMKANEIISWNLSGFWLTAPGTWLSGALEGSKPMNNEQDPLSKGVCPFAPP